METIKRDNSIELYIEPVDGQEPQIEIYIDPMSNYVVVRNKAITLTTPKGRNGCKPDLFKGNGVKRAQVVVWVENL